LSDESRSDTPAPPEGALPPEKRPFGGWGDLLKHWVLFLGVLGLMVALNQWKVNWVNIKFCQFTAKFFAGVMTLLGQNGHSVGVNVGTDICKFTIIGECTAYYPISIFIAAVVAFPTPWLRRLVGVVVGVPVMLLINQVRLVSLCYIDRVVSASAFDIIHIVIWQSLIIFLTVLLWVLWVTMYARR
jgi:exosortase/archaeosortase family protein